MTGSYGTLIETLRFGLDSVSWLEVELAAFLCSAAAALASARTTTRELGHVLLCLDDGKYCFELQKSAMSEDCAFAGVAASEAQGPVQDLTRLEASQDGKLLTIILANTCSSSSSSSSRRRRNRRRRRRRGRGSGRMRGRGRGSSRRTSSGALITYMFAGLRPFSSQGTANQQGNHLESGCCRFQAWRARPSLAGCVTLLLRYRRTRLSQEGTKFEAFWPAPGFLQDVRGYLQQTVPLASE